MAQYTNLYSEQKNLNNFNKTDSAEMKIMIALHMLFGVLNYPRSRMYWANKYRINIIADNMSRNRFFQLRNCFHVIDNESISNDNRDKFVKIRPLYNSFIKRCSELPKEKKICIDEQIIPFKGNLSIKQYIKGKPTPWGIKIFL